MRWTESVRRRTCLQWALAFACSGLSVTARAAPAAAKRGRPRYWLQMLLSGGIDPLFSLDPKGPGDLDNGIDIPYAPKDISRVSGLPLGPFFAPLAQHSGKFAVLKGINVNTVNHYTGSAQFLRMRTRVSQSMPSFLELATWGRRTSRQPGWVQETSGRSPSGLRFSNVWKS
jgi:hypothetical protein